MTVSDEFVRESTSQLRALSDGLIAIEQAPEDGAALDEAFRTAHSLKGNCAMAGLDEASAVAHAVEDVLSAVRTGDVRPEPNLIDAALDGTDTIEELVTATREDGERAVDHEATVETLRETLAAREEADADAAPIVREPIDATEEREVDRPDDLDADVLDALDTAAEYDDLDELLAAMDDGDDIDEIPDLPEAKSLGEGAEPTASDDPDAAAPTDAAANDSASSSDDAFGGDGPFEVSDDDADSTPSSGAPGGEETNLFASVQAEVAAEEADLAELQEDIDAVSFGEFDGDDDLSIEELIAADPADEAGDDGGFRFGEDRNASDDATSPDPTEDPSADGSSSTAADDDGFGAPFGTAGDAEASPETATGFDGSGPFAEPSSGDESASTAESGSTAAPAGEEADLFASVQAEVVAEEADLAELQEDIDAVSFGEFDEDDDLSIEELIAADPADEATKPAAAAGTERGDVDEADAATDAVEAADDVASPPPVPDVSDDLAPATVAAEGPKPTVPAVTPAVPEHPDDLRPAVTVAEGSVEVPDVPAGTDTTGEAADDAVEEPVSVDYAALAWGDLQRHAADRSVYRPGMTRAAVETALATLDDGGDVEAAISAAAHVDAEAADAAEAAEAAESPVTAMGPTPDESAPTGEGPDAPDVPPLPDGLRPAVMPAEGPVEVPDAPTDAPEVPTVPDDLAPAVTAASDDVDVPDVPEGASDDLVEPETEDEPDLDVGVEELLADAGFDDLSEADAEDEPEPDPDVGDLLDASFEERDTDVEFDRDTATEAFESRFGDLFGTDDAVVTRMVTSLAESSRADLFADPAADRQRVERDRVQSITVDVENAEALLSMVEELTATRFRLEASLEGARSEETVDALAGLQSVTANLRGTVMDLRLMPFETATRDLQRLVRDTARAQDKRVSLDVSGREVGLDRSVIDSIGAPLVHIVRNAVDHGIESPDAREAVGKDPQGSVEVRAERARDGVVIEIEDDGRGIDVDAVRQRVVDNDILSAEEAAELPPEELFPYVFEPGFSTAEEVTDVSGRGVGMDVVDRVASDLGGSVDVESTPGEGTTVRLRLPITVAVAEVMFVQSGDERYGIPMTAVEEVEEPSPLDTDAGERHVVSGPAGSDGEPAGSDGAAPAADGAATDSEERLPLVRLAEAFDTPGAHAEPGVAIRLRPETRRAALHCDRVVETREVVIRPFEGALGEVPGVSGATLLGDGELVNIIDVATI